MTRGRIARGQHRPRSRPPVGGRPRPARPGRQRPIRSTITILLVLPLISLLVKRVGLHMIANPRFPVWHG